MRSVDELSTRFREQGFRVTPQRQAIFRLLHGDQTHPTVEALHDAAAAEMPAISLRTVYQTVHDLETLGEVSLLHVGTGSVRVDPNVEVAHQHVVCRVCHKVRDVDVDSHVLALPDEHADGFAVSEVQVVFRGVCAECAPTVDPHGRRSLLHPVL